MSTYHNRVVIFIWYIKYIYKVIKMNLSRLRSFGNTEKQIVTAEVSGFVEGEGVVGADVVNGVKSISNEYYGI